MQLKFTLHRGGETPSADIVVTSDTGASVGAVATAIAERDPLPGQRPQQPTLRIDDGGGRILDPGVTLADAGLASGQHISLVERSAWKPATGDAAAATLTVLSGPDAGKTYPLRAGSNQIGRGSGNDVSLSDGQVSKAHVRINVGEILEAVDLGSANGTIIGGELVQRAAVRPTDQLLLGETLLSITQHHDGGVQSAGTLLFNRSPRIDVVYPGAEIPAPEPPEALKRNRIPVIPMFAPVLFGCIMFAVTRQLITIMFVALSPMMMVGNVLESKIFGGRDHKRAVEAFREALLALDTELTRLAGVEATQRRLEHPETEVLVDEASRRERSLWSYRPDARGFLDVRLGLGTMPSRNRVEYSPKQGAVPELDADLRQVIASHATVDAVPVVASLVASGSLGFAGPRDACLPLARSAIAQITSLHSPAEVTLAAVVGSGATSDWEALKWLPHVGGDHSPIGRDNAHLAASPGGVQHLVSALEGLVEARLEDDTDREGPTVPAVVVLVEDDAPVERSRLVELGERGRSCGVHMLWIASTVAGLPAICRSYVELDPNQPTSGLSGFVDGDGINPGGAVVSDVALEGTATSRFASFARTMCPVVDAGARVDDSSDLPRTVSLPSLTGVELLDRTDAIVDRWRTSNSVPGEFVRRKKPNHLRSVVGSSAGGAMVLDLREHGPHALVGGTTGSGKSEFLQSWILGMALEHSPARVTFLFVDYKGGAAFAECVNLPHCVGLVTDLSPQLVQRALASLNAELHHREELLNRKRAKDLIELEKAGDPEAPPSLVIVVDEFAALVQEVPEFVDGVINVAQRGRSLGLHLVLATQRPAGVITGNLRANTNLRVALRVADEADSDDVVGSKIAAGFDPGVPGRAVAKTGPGRLLPFQSGYVGGHTSDTPPPPSMVIQEFAFGVGREWEAPETGEPEVELDPGPTDLQRLVRSVDSAYASIDGPAPRRPWLDELADAYDLANLPSPSRDDAVLTFGILDDPARQQQYPISFHPDIDGNMAVIGTGGSGKSAFLRTIGIVAGLGFRGGPCHVYGLDFGARGLSMLESLPHVGSVVTADDDERIQRLLSTLRAEIDERADRYAKVRAGSIAEYRELADAPDEARLVLLLDNVGAFRNAYEVGPNARLFDLLLSIAADGRPVGVHVMVSADRPGAIPSALNSVIQKKLVLRLASDTDLAAMSVPADWFDGHTPPGRGYFDGNHVQVLVLGGTSNTSRQSEAIEGLAAQLSERDDRRPAPAIQRLPDFVSMDTLPDDVGGLPAIGISGDTLAPIGIVPDDVFLVSGPPQSGRTTAMAAVCRAIGRAKPDSELVYLGPGRSPLLPWVDWTITAAGADAIGETARDLHAKVSGGWNPAAIILEDHASLLNGPAEQPVLDLLNLCRSNGVMVVADGEIGAIGSWPLQTAVKAGRHGIILQPDQHDGDQIYKTPLPRVQRSDLPPGRGFYIRGGRAHLIQVAVPEQ